jgi:DNA modification methylase
LLARRENGEIIAGHTRLKAAIKIGMAEVPVRYLDLTDDEAHALALADNKVGELAEWDDESLSDILKGMSEAGDNIEGLGWDSKEIEGLISGETKPTAGDDEAPEAEEGEPDSVAGGLYELGPHRLLCGSCRDSADVSRLFDGRRVNLAFTSPPYASQREYDASSGFKPIPPDEYVAWFEAVQASVRANLADDGSWFVNIKEHCEDGQRSLYVKDLTIAHVRQWAWRLCDEFCWLRQSLPGDPNSMRKFKNAFEPVFHFAGGVFKFRPDEVRHESDHAFVYADQKAAGRDISAASQGKGSNAQSPVGQRRGLAYPSNVLDIKQGANVVGHSAAFPVGLPAFFVLAYTDPGDAVFDPFMGSGTTMIAAAKHGRVAFGTEISPRYCDVIRRRWTRWAKENSRDAGTGALDG